MKVIGLTGGIGTGKSTAAAYLKSKGFAHIDADEIGRQLTAARSPILTVLDAVFGSAGEMGSHGIKVLSEDGTLDRKALASIVFTDKEKKQKLDELMFNAITEEIDRQISAYKKAHTVENKKADMTGCVKKYMVGCGEDEGSGVLGILLDAPLLFEAGLNSRCDTVILIVADEAARIDRVCRRDGVTDREVRNRINSQMSDEEKIRLADIVIDNTGSEKELYKKLDDSLLLG